MIGPVVVGLPLDLFFETFDLFLEQPAVNRRGPSIDRSKGNDQDYAYYRNGDTGCQISHRNVLDVLLYLPLKDVGY
jgi:hypothetical protein